MKYQDILGLDVAMDYLPRMSQLQCTQQLPHDFAYLIFVAVVVKNCCTIDLLVATRTPVGFHPRTTRQRCNRIYHLRSYGTASGCADDLVLPISDPILFQILKLLLILVVSYLLLDLLHCPHLLRQPILDLKHLPESTTAQQSLINDIVELSVRPLHAANEIRVLDAQRLCSFIFLLLFLLIH
jgi:hypothetical protein